MRKFDLGKSLNGEPVVLRNGKKAFVRYHEREFETDHPLIGYTIYGTGGSESSWTVEGNFFADKEEAGSDIVGMWTEPLVFNHWNLLDLNFNYLAKDENGEWWAYPKRPQVRGRRWMIGGEPSTTDLLNKTLFPECNWKESLIKRTEK